MWQACDLVGQTPRRRPARSVVERPFQCRAHLRWRGIGVLDNDTGSDGLDAAAVACWSGVG